MVDTVAVDSKALRQKENRICRLVLSVFEKENFTNFTANDPSMDTGKMLFDSPPHISGLTPPPKKFQKAFMAIFMDNCLRNFYPREKLDFENQSM